MKRMVEKIRNELRMLLLAAMRRQVAAFRKHDPDGGPAPVVMAEAEIASPRGQRLLAEWDRRRGAKAARKLHRRQLKNRFRFGQRQVGGKGSVNIQAGRSVTLDGDAPELTSAWGNRAWLCEGDTVKRAGTGDDPTKPHSVHIKRHDGNLHIDRDGIIRNVDGEIIAVQGRGSVHIEENRGHLTIDNR